MAQQITNLESLEELARKIESIFIRKDQIGDYVGSGVGSVYRPFGNLTSPDPSKLIKDNLGNVYNITQEFVADSANFVDGNGKKFPAGTDIAVVSDDSGGYKFNVLSGFVDLSGYFKEDDIVQLSEVQEMLKEVFGDGA